MPNQGLSVKTFTQDHRLIRNKLNVGFCFCFPRCYFHRVKSILLLFLTFRTPLHGGQSRSWSAEQGKENKRQSRSTPMLLVRKYIYIVALYIEKNTPPPPHGADNEESKWQERTSRDASTCMPRCSAGFGPSRARTGLLRLVN